MRRNLFFVVAAVIALLGSMPPIGAQSSVAVLGSGGSDGLDAPPAPSCATPAFATPVAFDPIGNPAAEPRFGDGIGLVTSFSLDGFSVEPGVVHFDEVITHDGYATRPDAVPQNSERVHIELLLDGAVVASTPPTPDLADGPRSAWLAASLGSVTVPEGADGLRIVHDGDGASPNSLIVAALCLRNEAEPADQGEAPADVAPQTESDPDDGDGSAISITSDSGDGTTDGAVRPPSEPSEALPTTTLPQLALTGTTTSLLASLAVGLVAVGIALVLVDRHRRASI